MGAFFHMHESKYTAAVNKKLPKGIYAWKIQASFANGLPDTWYSGPSTDLWVEYKMVRTNKREIDCTKLLSPLQLRWLNTRYHEGRNVAVIVETPKGAIIFNGYLWNTPLKMETYCSFLSRQEVANWIAKYCSANIN